MIETGKQYTVKDNQEDKSGFKSAARLHQSKYRAETLKLPFDVYGNFLTKENGEQGSNFYSDFGIFKAVKNYRKYNKQLYSNMLRSEHIPFNFFIPLRQDLDLCKNVFNDILGNTIKSIESTSVIDNKENIKIEFAPKPKTQYLNDGTSFDAYIEYDHIDNSKGIIGIEVKYTEKEYELSGATEKNAINDLTSKYSTVSEKSGIYKSSVFDKLKSNEFRQIWRNHMLGESILQYRPDTFKHFTSLTFFPNGNAHFVETSKKYIELLHANANNFLTVTYEQYISYLKKHSRSKEYLDWIDYLQARYIIK